MLDMYALMRSPIALLEAASRQFAHGNLCDALTFCELAAVRIDYQIAQRATPAGCLNTAKWDRKAKSIVRKAQKAHA